MSNDKKTQLDKFKEAEKREGRQLMAIVAILIAKMVSLLCGVAFVSGLFVRHLGALVAIGIACGMVQSILLSAVRVTPVEGISWILGFAAGSIMCFFGWLIRGRRL